MKRKILKRICWIPALIAVVMLAACSSDDEEIPLWDESYPEKIVERLVGVPAYVDTIMYLHKGYACVFYSHDADLLDYDLSRDQSKIGMIAVKVKDLIYKGISFRSKVYVTADVTNRCVLNYDYADKVLHNTFDWNWGDHVIPCKAFLHDIRKRD